jgi:hypothetical protein
MFVEIVFRDKEGKSVGNLTVMGTVEGARELTVQQRGACNTPPAIHIPIPQPKKKVKKWQFLFHDEERGANVSTGHYTYENFGEFGHKWYRHIPETEITVEE